MVPVYLKAMRPRQWTKNVLVVAGPLAAGSFFEGDVLWATAVAFVTFCLVASAVYLVNDVIDRELDRQHPVKCARPIASGALSVRAALVGAVVLAAVGITAAVLLANTGLGVVLGVYAVVQLSYCLLLKNEPVIDLVIVSSGFLLRALAGGVAAGVDLSPWFLLVASFGSLFMVAGKRYSEVRLVGEGAGATRKSLETYSASYLRFVWGVAASVSVVVYTLWAIGLERDNVLLPQLSIVPFTIAILRYAVDIDRGLAGEPESIVLGDRVLQVLGLLWVVAVGASAVLG